MKIHVWGINYSPEVTGIGPYNTALCEFLATQGHTVRMITSFCYYPAWRKLPSERGTAYRTDQMDGVTVHRCWHYVPRKVSTLKRIAHELSFVTTSFLRQLFLPRPDLLIVISPPLLLGPAAWLICKLKASKFLFHVQDLQPDAAAGLGMLGEGRLLKALRRIERFTYKNAARVSGITPGMLRRFEERGVPREKTVYFPNGVDIPEFWRLPKRGSFRERHGYAEDDFLVVYSGNMGRKQGLQVLLEAATQVTNPHIKFLFCGDGAQRDALERYAQSLGLQNCRFLALQPQQHYHELLVDADLCVVAQQPGSGNCFFPSKLLKAISFSKPILAITEASTELAKYVREEGIGSTVSNSPEEAAEYLDEVSVNQEVLNAQARAALKVAKRFDLTAILIKFAQILSKDGCASRSA